MIARQTLMKLTGGALTAVLCLAFVASGFPKLMNSEVAAIEFAVWGYPGWLLFLVGLAEVAGAVALLDRRSAPWGLGLLAAVVAGAVVTHLRFQEWQALRLALSHGVVLAAVAWWRLRP